MSNYSQNSGQDIVYLDLSTSAIGASLSQSSADPAGKHNAQLLAFLPNTSSGIDQAKGPGATSWGNLDK
jgi:hypothetical protein